MELVKRYVYAVTRQLPEKQRPEIEQELSGLIEDMLEERSGGKTASEQEIEAVLLELGNPDELADKYRGSGRYLIGPHLFNTYLTILKIVLASIGIAMTAVFIIDTILDPTNISGHFVDNIVSFLFGCFQGFAWVTVTFAILEYSGINDTAKLGLSKAEAWKPSQLPSLPDDHTRIKRSEPIASIIFTIIIAGLFIVSVDKFGVWIFHAGDYSNVIPFFQQDVFRSFLPLIIVLLLLQIAKDIMKLILGKWTLRLAVFHLVLTMLNFVLMLFMFSDTAIWNPDFILQLSQSGYLNSESDVVHFISSKNWNWITQNFVVIAAIVLVIDVVTILAKMVKIRKIA